MPRVLMAFKAPDGGAAENVVQLARGLGGHGWEVELAGPLSASVYERVPASIRVHRLPITGGYGPLRADASALGGLIGLARAGGFDLLHAHSAQPSVLARLARLAGGPPVVYTPHCFPFVGNTTRLRSRAGLAIEWALGPLTAAFIDVSEHERRAAAKRRVGHRTRHHVVLNASEACPDVAPDTELLRFRGGAPLVLAVTSLRAQKQVDVFLRALPEVFAEIPMVRAAVVGNGPEEDSLRLLADRLGLTQSGRLAMLHFNGPAARYLKCADVYALSSAFESLPIGILEALACGVPQVASDVGGVSEAIGDDTGILVPPANPAELARGLVELLRDAERRRRMADASRIRHGELFSLPRMLAETVGVYEAVLVRSSRGVQHAGCDANRNSSRA
jgi:glycosyltransferase involved in cell wall biosynthesis